MKKIKVALLFGGRSGEHEVSVVSALSIYKNLDPNKYDVQLIGISQEGKWLLPEDSWVLANKENPKLTQLSKAKENITLLPYKSENALMSLPGGSAPAAAKTNLGSFDVVFPVLHGTNGEDGTIQGLLELAQIPYVGSGVLGSAVGMDKDVAKRVLRDAGIPVVPFITIRKQAFAAKQNDFLNQCEKEFGYPYFVKPANAGSSVGVHKIKSRDQAVAAFNDAFQFDLKILAEKAVNCRELEISVLGNDNPQASIVGEIRPNHEFYSYEAKYVDANGADLFIPAQDVTPEETKRLQELAIRAFIAIDGAGLARVDFLMDKTTREIYLNELNTLPGFTQISMYPKLWEASGVSYSQLLDRLLELAIDRGNKRKALKTSYDR